MTLIDTSAWIEFFRRKGNTGIKERVRDFIASGEAAYTCPVAFELFAGARSDEVPDLRAGLDFAVRFELLAKHWDTAGALAGGLHAKGIRIPASDLLIAVVASGHGIPIMTTDAHFTIIKNESLPDLRLA